jgi:hypothetical protein
MSLGLIFTYAFAFSGLFFAGLLVFFHVSGHDEAVVAAGMLFLAFCGFCCPFVLIFLWLRGLLRR